MTEKLIKSKERVKKFAEVFTPEHIVKQMVQLIDDELGDEDYGFKTWFDPAVGTGNFPAEILHRKLQWCDKHNKSDMEKLRALSTIYAVDIQADNVEETRERLLRIFYEYVPKGEDPLIDAVAPSIVEMNIVLGDTLNELEEITFIEYHEEGFPLKVDDFKLIDMMSEEDKRSYFKEKQKNLKAKEKKANKK